MFYHSLISPQRAGAPPLNLQIHAALNVFQRLLPLVQLTVRRRRPSCGWCICCRRCFHHCEHDALGASAGAAAGNTSLQRQLPLITLLLPPPAVLLPEAACLVFATCIAHGMSSALSSKRCTAGTVVCNGRDDPAHVYPHSVARHTSVRLKFAAVMRSCGPPPTPALPEAATRRPQGCTASSRLAFLLGCP